MNTIVQITSIGVILLAIGLLTGMIVMLIKWRHNRHPKQVTLIEPFPVINDCRDKANPTADSEPDIPANQNALKSSRGQLNNYICCFLTPFHPMARQGIYIDRELHAKVTAIMGNVGLKQRMTVGNYVDNVLTDHFSKYEKEVKTVCSEGIKKIL